MMRLLDLEAVRSTLMHSEPFEWGIQRRTFSSPEAAHALAETFPKTGYTHYTRHSQAKAYDTYGRFLIKMGYGEIHEPSSQPPIWRQLAEEFLSAEYVSAVEQASGVKLADTHLEAVFWRLTDGCTIDPHTDNPLKKISHLFYFNDRWSSEQGGCLRILRSWRMDDYVEEIPPLLDTSLLIVRGRRSWHGYPPIRGGVVRKAVQISFCQCAAA